MYTSLPSQLLTAGMCAPKRSHIVGGLLKPTDASDIVEKLLFLLKDCANSFLFNCLPAFVVIFTIKKFQMH